MANASAHRRDRETSVSATYLVVRVRLTARQLESLLLCGDPTRIVDQICQKTTGFLNYLDRWTNKAAGAYPYHSLQMATESASRTKPIGRKVVVRLPVVPRTGIPKRTGTGGLVLGVESTPLRVASVEWPTPAAIVEAIGRLHG